MRAIAFALLLASASPAKAEAWLTVGSADGRFRLEMPVPFDLPPSETEPDGTVTFSYLHETPDVALRFEMVEAAPCSCEPVAAPVALASRAGGTRIVQARVHVVGSRTYRLVAISTPELEHDPMILRFLGSMRVAP
jgi:hypothetical protein